MYTNTLNSLTLKELIVARNLLNSSITYKWLPICLGDKVGNGAGDCALCKEYSHKNIQGNNCKECPFYLTDGQKCDQSTSNLEAYWHSDAEEWFLQRFPIPRNISKQRAYRMLFALEDMYQEYSQRIDTLKAESLG